MPRTWKRLALWLAVAAVVAGSLTVRVVHRGSYYPGFDVAGSSSGLHILSTNAFPEALAHLWSRNRHHFAPFPYFSAVAALLPGAATAVLPWQYWAHLTTLLVFASSLWLTARAAGLGRDDGWIVLLAVGASPLLLTLAVCGMPWATAFLPHAVALRLVLAPRLVLRPLVSLVAGMLAVELSWHCYELGKTVPALFLGAALLVPAAPWTTRIAWVATSLYGVVQALWFPTMHVTAYVTPDLLRADAAWDGLAIVARMLFVDRYLDYPTLVVAGLLACLVMSRTRLLVAGMFALQVVLLGGLALAFEGGWQVRPRRFVLVDAYALTLVATLFGERVDVRRTTRAVRVAVVTVLVVGATWQLTDLVRFVRTPFPKYPGGFAFTLPYAHSQVDYMVTFENVDWADELIRRAQRGEPLFLVYNFSAYDENLTNPSGILERLHVALGHERFVRSVFAFGSVSCHHNCLPVRPMQALEPFLDRLRAGDPVTASAVTGYVVTIQPMDTPVFLAERARQLRGLEARFHVHYEDPETAKFRRFSLTPRGAQG